MEHGLREVWCIFHEKHKMLDQEESTKKIIGSAFEVYRVLGYGFLEKVYQKAMQVELIKRKIKAELEAKIKVSYKGVLVGDYQADLYCGRPSHCRTQSRQKLQPRR
ncbi:GxxExxY protein [Tautonia marina]|uniref:GxxExxY protein n=1 Tax=Tautonia marina TaxID=2653855 RepID=UPI00191BCBFE